MEKGVSFRRPEIIERKANEVLQKAKEKGFYNFDSATPIDLIVEKVMRLRVDFEDFKSINPELDGVLGALDLEGRIIWIDESLNHTIDSNFTKEARCNYTMAHEAGHYQFHRKLYRLNKNLSLFHDITNPRTKALEIQANMFASYLLMPTSLMTKKWNEIDPRCPIEKAIYEMMQFFRISREAMINRLKVMGFVDINYK